MESESQHRLVAARALGKLLASPSKRHIFSDNSYQPGSQIIVALESDPVSVVLGRCQKYSPPVVVAAYYPEKQVFRFIAFEPQSRSEAPDDVQNVAAEVSIGMLIDSNRREESRFRLSDWDAPVRAHELACTG